MKTHEHLYNTDETGNVDKSKLLGILKAFINIILFALLFLIVFVLLLCSKDHPYTNTYSDAAIDVIRVFSLFEIIISIILKIINKGKAVMAVLILSNIVTLYKFISTFII